MKITGSFKISWIAASFVTVITLVLISEWIEKMGFLTFPSGFRHASVLMIFLVNYTLFGRSLVLNKYYKIALSLIFIYLFIAFFAVTVSLLHYLLGISFTFLFVFIFVLGSNTKIKISVIVKLFNALIIVIALMSAYSFILGIMTGTVLREVPTLFREAGAFGVALNIGTILSISLYIITEKKKYLYIAGFFSFGVVLTVLKKSIISNFIIWSLYAINGLSLKGRMKMIVLMIVVAALGYSFVGNYLDENIQQNTEYYKAGASNHVRIVMYLVSFEIAVDYFPYGCGMGTFASIPSIWGDYSKVYYDYGINNIAALSPKAVAANDHCLFDTYWPHILGELGFLGLILFLFLWFFPAVSSLSVLRKCNVPEIRGMSFYIFVIAVVMTNEGFALYTPEIAPFIFFHSGIVGLCYYHLSKYKLQNKGGDSIRIGNL